MALNLNRLNEPQRAAVLHGDGPLLVLAGAGSGKTSTMTFRIAHLIAERGVAAGNILGLSFTRKAAEELKERVVKLVSDVAGPERSKGISVSTFHSLCARMLREHAAKIGYQPNFTIMDRNDQVDTLRRILKHIKVDDRKFDPDTILFEIGQSKNRFLGPEQAEAYFLESKRLPGDYALITASAFGKYQEQLHALNSMDFDDLLFNTVRLLESCKDVRELFNRRFRYVLVDEYQDTNPAQFRLIRLLTERSQNICVVGDDDQSIYGWRGADAAHILEFRHQFKGARVITLDQNYRSTTTILDAANKVIIQNRKRHPKSLWSDKGKGEPITELIVEEDRAEATTVAEEILGLAREIVEGRPRRLRPWKDFAVLYRSNPQSRLFEEALRMQGVPYKIVGSMSFLDRKEIKDVLSYWRLIVNPKDDASARRVLNWPGRGIGRTTMEAVGAEALKLNVSFTEALELAPKIAPRGADGAARFLGLITQLRQELSVAPVNAEGMASWARRSLAAIGVKKALEDDNDQDPVKAQRQWENVDELAHAMGQMDFAELATGEAGRELTGLVVLREYLAKLSLEALDEKEDDDSDEGERKEKDQVTLLTLHGSKGLEFPVVFLVGMEDGLLPHRKVIEEGGDLSEERRLCYVGITRAKEKLILTRARNRIRYGKPVPRTPSRFLADIPKELLHVRDKSSTPDLSSKEARDAHETMVKDYLAEIRAKIRGGD